MVVRSEETDGIEHGVISVEVIDETTGVVSIGITHDYPIWDVVTELNPRPEKAADYFVHFGYRVDVVKLTEEKTETHGVAVDSDMVDMGVDSVFIGELVDIGGFREAATTVPPKHLTGLIV